MSPSSPPSLGNVPQLLDLDLIGLSLVEVGEGVLVVPDCRGGGHAQDELESEARKAYEY